MLKLIFTKFKYNFKLYLWLILGLTFMIGVISLLPMMYSGALYNMIIRGFEEQYESKSEFPALVSNIGSAGASDVEKQVDDKINDLKQQLGIPVLNTQIVYYSHGGTFTSEYSGGSNLNKSSFIEYGYADNVKIIKEYKGETGEGIVPCSASQATLDHFGLVLGEVITMDELKRADGSPLRFRITKLIEETGADEYKWFEGFKTINGRVFISMEDLLSLSKEMDTEVKYVLMSMVDYRYINVNNAARIYYVLYQMERNDEGNQFTETIIPVLKDYFKAADRIIVILYIMTIPVIGLIVMFLYMLIQRIVNSEIRDISMLRSRGKRRSSIIGLYLLQGLLLSILAYMPGVGIGCLFGKLLSHISGFMNFNVTGDAAYVFVPEMFLYALYAVIAANIMMIIPVIKVSDTTIIRKQNAKYKRSIKPVWEKYFIDLILLVVSVYLLYTHTKQIDVISQDVLAGKGMDPVIFFNASLFTIAVCLVFVRLTFILTNLIYKIGKNKMKLPAYVSFTEILRGRQKNTFIFVFMTLTIALSIFHASVARTIDTNKQTRLIYNTGADVIIRESWPYHVNRSQEKQYEIPDYEALQERFDEFDIKQKTKVLNIEGASINHAQVQFSAIQTKEFGQIAHMPDGVNSEHWYNSLNRLADMYKGVIISRNLAEANGYNIGDWIDVKVLDQIDLNVTTEDNYKLCVADIVDGWPGYERYKYEYVDDKLQVVENNLAVMNYSYAVQGHPVRQYEIWCNASLNGNAIPKSHYNNKILEKLSLDLNNSSEIKITNSIFTLEVVGALILCAVGFMIYWITSVQNRETLFGIYRAMGISAGETNRMIWIEELFLTIVSILVGLVSGLISIRLFTPLFTALYLPENSLVKLDISMNKTDIIVVLAVVGVIFVVCSIILSNVMRKLKISDAVKLGED